MPTALGHLAVPLAARLALGPERMPVPLLLASCAAAVLPDADVLAFAAGIPYEHPLGHRGCSHSIVFAAAVAGLGTIGWRRLGRSRAGVFLALFGTALSHGVLDAFTDGGLGIAFLWPFSEARWFAPVRPIAVSPIGVGRFLGARGAIVLRSELLWVWLPSLVAGLLAAWSLRRRSVA